mgnify:FL=1
MNISGSFGRVHRFLVVDRLSTTYSLGRAVLLTVLTAGNLVKPSDSILFTNGAVEIPNGSGIPDIHRKLAMLAEGKTWTPTDADQDNSERLHVQAEQSGGLAVSEEPDIVQADKSETTAAE